jgi:STE24 endopeptidase
MQDVTGTLSNDFKHVAPSAVLIPSASEPPSASSSQFPQDFRSKQEAKRYSRLKITVGISEAILFFSVGIIVVIFGISSGIESLALNASQNPYIALLVYASVLGLGEMVLGFPLGYYSSFHIEHKFKLSNQTFRKWLWEGAKSLLVGIPITAPVLLMFYYCLRTFQETWWLPVGSVLFLFSVVLARIAPVLIFPLFYKFKPVEDIALQDRILRLCEKAGVKVEGVFVFDMSKNTKKANAAFTGIGRSKRIILGDTLVANFTDEEIETVFAHELGHYTLKHNWTMIAVGTLSSFLGLFLAAQAYRESLSWFGFTVVDQLAALPLLALWLSLYSLLTTPLVNAISRAHERAADAYALQTAGNKQAFINAMRKLALVNLADSQPHPFIEFFFHSHPSIEKRVQAAERWRG